MSPRRESASGPGTGPDASSEPAAQGGPHAGSEIDVGHVGPQVDRGVVALTPAPGVGIGAGVILFATGAIAGRADVALFGVVLLVAVAVALSRRRPAEADITLTQEPRDADDPTAVRIRIAVDAPDAEVVRVTAVAREAETMRLVLAGRFASAVVRVPIVHSGEQEIIAVGARPVGADSVWIGEPSAARRIRRAVQPRTVPMPFLPLPHALRGLTGAHDAVRAGDGGEFRDIHPYAAGDRLRRIDWKATARLARRPGELFVRRTHATSDVDVAIVFDDSDDVDGAVRDWILGDRLTGLHTSMDVSREAAWSIASAYLATADQVSFQLLSRLQGAVPRGSGARHRERLRSAILHAEPQGRYARVRTPYVAPGALVVVLSTFLDDDTGRLVELWRAAGHRVLAVDTLPRLVPQQMRREVRAAARVVLGERADRLADIRAVGADLLVWDAPDADRIAALRAMARVRRRR
ncbi:DUF58 domain-containing protein [Microbacterium sp. ASV49]|uniref:DUF58 domain-containing protein n=1 Tax=Microbacterium candidum TaxID=3041922 RepID=A0ABT7N4H8_9MICO|nr:DUF58 domain-containing protein [Microbacterium sp. ASV49]MDL9981571.1 DUF58 domain-containing protein [Microbacterium sp. ASV49]